MGILVEHNYYQLMQLELFADVSEVKKKYRELARLYHPDKNPRNKHSEEYFKIITQGYSILNEPLKKLVYDEALRNYYKDRGGSQESFQRKQNARERLKKYRERKRKEIIDDYVKSENEFPHMHRMFLAVGVFLSGVLMCYNRWFINYEKFDVIYVMIGFIIFGLGCYLIANNVYRREAFRHALSLKEGRVSARPVRVFVILLFVTPVVFFASVYTTKKIHLTYFYDITTVKKVSFFNDQVMYHYEINDELIARSSDAIPGETYTDYSKMRVKFSRINPNISELVILEK